MESEAIAGGTLPAQPKRSPEELIALKKAILGFGPVISNANTINRGQMPQLPLGSVVEVNHVFDNDSVRPIMANRLPDAVAAMVLENALSIEACYAGIKARDLQMIFDAFMAQPICTELSSSRGEALFREMVLATREYLDPWYDLSGLE